MTVRGAMIAVFLSGVLSAASACAETENPLLIAPEPGMGSDLTSQPNVSITGSYPCGDNETCPFASFLQLVCALVVVQDGAVVYQHFPLPHTNSYKLERDEDPNSRDKRYGLASITKSITSTLIGLAQTDPRIKPLDLNQTAGSVDGELAGQARDVKLIELLRMRSGLEEDDDGRHTKLRARTVGNADPRTGMTFERAVSAFARIDEKDGEFRYSNMSSAILGVVLEARLKQTAGLDVKTLRDALKKWIWDPELMAGTAKWKADYADSPSPYCCFNMRAYDLAKFGQFVLEQRRTPNARLHEWLTKATTFDAPVKPDCYTGHRYRRGYGYQWWTFEDQQFGFTGIGTGGHFLHIIPDAGLVIVQFGTLPADAAEDEFDAYACRSFGAHDLIRQVLGH